MFRFLRSRIGNSYEIKNDDLDECISHVKNTTHGFPQRVSCFNVDDRLGLLAVGTRDGRLLIYQPNCSQISTTIENNLPIVAIYFIPGQNVLILLCNGKGTQLFYRCQIQRDRLHFTQLKEEMPMRRITCCQVFIQNTEEGFALLIGTNIGNIYALWVQSLKLAEYIIFSGTSLADFDDLKSPEQRSINAICIHPDENSTMFLLFNNSLVLYYDKSCDKLLKQFTSSCNISHMSFGCASKSLLCSHQDGTYSLLDTSNGSNELRKPFGELKCTKMKKILAAKSKNIGEEFTIFSGGIPEDLADRDTLTLFCADKSLILDFDSPLLDFIIFQKDGVASTLFILCAEEFVAIDLCDPLWRMFPLPYLHPIHASPITCISAVSGLSDQTAALLTRIAREQRDSSQIYSKNKWPLTRPSQREHRKAQKDLLLIVTGHENGVVNIWLANDLQFRLWISYNTARDFQGYKEEEVLTATSDGNGHEADIGLPPVRKAGIFDPYSDDHRLSIHRIHFDSRTGQFAVGGQAGQVMVYEGLIRSRTIPANEILVLDMTTSAQEDLNNTKLRGESAIQPRTEQMVYPVGFSLLKNIVVQFKPAVPITAIAWDSTLGLLAAGNEFGYAICSLPKREVLLVKTLLSAMDVVEISNKDSALSRFKSVKKSIRQSFRRKKRQNPDEDSVPEKTIRQSQRFRGNEREIAPRKINPNALDGETPNSLIKTISFKHCNLHGSYQTYLFVGSQASRVFIHALGCPTAEGHISSLSEQCPLVKEIRLHHNAPIVALECLKQSPQNDRLFIFSEEQIRSLTLPHMRPSNFKYRLTAVEGSRIRKVAVVQLTGNRANKRLKNPENLLAVTTNRGELFLLHPSQLKRPYRLQFTQPSDQTGISFSVVTQDGQMLHLRAGGSELDRCSFSGNSPNNPK